MLYIRKNTRVHFIGVGGIGMSGIAEILLKLGYNVSGSDAKKSSITKNLESLGATIFYEHQAENVQGASVVVYSTAISHSNLEVAQAKEMGIPLIRRAEMLAELMRIKYGIAIAGTHGKTTTTSFIATIFHENGLDTTYVIGGVVENLGGHAKLGKSDILVAEADESDGSFLLLGPITSVIGNIDEDHMEFYGSLENLIQSFTDFANKIPFYGVNIINGQDHNVAEVIKGIKRPYMTFGVDGKGFKNYYPIDYLASNVKFAEKKSIFDLIYKNEHRGTFEIMLPGIHNIQNALAAIAICHQLGLDLESIAKGIKKFKSVGRRLESVFKKGRVEILDDYAHHPTAVLKTIQTIRSVRQGKLVVIFEPHRYSRTEKSWKDFLHCFNDADKLYMLPIYAASEGSIGGINGRRLVEDINALHPDLGTYVEDLSFIKNLIHENEETKDESLTILAMGAGAISRNLREFIETYDSSSR